MGSYNWVYMFVLMCRFATKNLYHEKSSLFQSGSVREAVCQFNNKRNQTLGVCPFDSRAMQNRVGSRRSIGSQVLQLYVRNSLLHEMIFVVSYEHGVNSGKSCFLRCVPKLLMEVMKRKMLVVPNWVHLGSPIDPLGCAMWFVWGMGSHGIEATQEDNTQTI